MDIKLTAQKRESGEKLNKDVVPAVLYGKGLNNEHLKINRVEFEKVFKVAGESNLINLDFGDGVIPVVVKDIQTDVLKGFFTHVDFYQVNMKEVIKAEIPLHFIGEAKAVKELGGVLIQDMDAVEVECLPGDLVDHIDVDISVLHDYTDAIRLEDLKIPNGLTILSQTNDMVAAVREPRVEVEEEVVETAEEGEKKEGEKNDATGEGAKEDNKKEEKK